ncbi:MAG: pseudouridine synthase [Bacillus subtilis]|nr:pseudouridine synthase [Bacillus subtilis]
MVPRILYEDNHLLVAVKPPGVLSQAGDLALSDMLTLLKDDLKHRHNKPGNVFLGLVHRLDTNVGGVMVFAKTSKAASRLSASIRERFV